MTRTILIRRSTKSANALFPTRGMPNVIALMATSTEGCADRKTASKRATAPPAECPTTVTESAWNSARAVFTLARMTSAVLLVGQRLDRSLIYGCGHGLFLFVHHASVHFDARWYAGEEDGIQWSLGHRGFGKAEITRLISSCIAKKKPVRLTKDARQSPGAQQ
jgi:hypothetical protein